MTEDQKSFNHPSNHRGYLFHFHHEEIITRFKIRTGDNLEKGSYIEIEYGKITCIDNEDSENPTYTIEEVNDKGVKTGNKGEYELDKIDSFG